MSASIEAQFSTVLAGHGLTPPDIIADGVRRRFDADDEKRGKRSAWYVLHGDGVPAGAFGNWKTGLSEKWSAKSDQSMTQAERYQVGRRVEQAKALAADEEKAEQEAAAQNCIGIVSAALDATDDNPYCLRKGIKPFGLKEFKDKRTLIVPIRDGGGQITSLQFIAADGTKRFKTNGRIQGCYYSFGGKPDTTILICEGFATGASLHMATGYPVAVAFNAGNLEAVATALRGKLPTIQLILCADNDSFNQAGNVGLTKATDAAQAVGGLLALPVFQSDDNQPTDFNDLHQVAGLEAVKAVIDAAQAVASPDTQSGEQVLADLLPQVEVTDPPLGFDETIQQLAALRPHEYDRVRVSESKRLGVQQKTLDGAVKSARTAEDDAIDTPFEVVEPWPDAVDPAALLSEIAATVRRFIVCEPETAHAAALWVAMTWVIDVVQIAPLAVITAPEKRCGKSELRRLLAKVVSRPLEADGMSASVLFRGYDLWKPTLLVDEFDTFVKDDEDLRGIFNAGHQRGGCVWRCVGDDHTPKRFDVFGAKALAGIGKLPDTMMDRAILLELRRKLDHEVVERLRYADDGLFDAMRRKLARFADDYSEAVRIARPELPKALNDRAQDNWEPLLAIADCAGGVWPSLATKAAMKLSGEKVESKSIGVEMLADIQEIFETKRCDRISSADLITALCEDDEKPWATFNRGFPIKPRQVVSRLREFGIASNTIRVLGSTAKGYLKKQFDDAFERYLADPAKNAALSVTPSQPNTGGGLGVTSLLPVTDTKVTRNSDVTRKPNAHAGCDGVTDMRPILTGAERTHSKGDDIEVEI